MPKVMNVPTTSPARPGAKHATATPAPLPSIFDIGRHARAARDALDRFEMERVTLPDGKGERHAVLAASELAAYNREQSLLNLALALPARTLGDATAQLVATLSVLDDMDANDIPETETISNIKRLRGTIAGMLPIIAGAAGVDLAEILDADTQEFYARQVPAAPRAV